MDFVNPGLVYGLYAAGLIVFGVLYTFSLKKVGRKPLCALWTVLFGTVLAIVCARLFFLLPALVFGGAPSLIFLFHLIILNFVYLLF